MEASFFKIRVPELESLPPEERQAALERFAASPEARRLERTYASQGRTILLGVTGPATLGFASRAMASPPGWLLPVLLFAPIAAVLALLAATLAYRRRLTIVLRRYLRGSPAGHWKVSS